MTELSIVIPAFNEAARIGQTIARLAEYWRAAGGSPEIIVVDDGSSDGTGTVVARAAEGAGIDVRLLRHAANRGKGHAVRAGVGVSVGRLVLICDADLSTPIEELRKLRAAIDAGADIAVASRDLPDSRLEPAQPALRRVLAGAFRGLRRMLLLRVIRDTQCGFKLFRGEVARSLFAESRIDGWLFDCEVLKLAARRGLRIAEVGVVWRDDRDSRVRLQRDLPRAVVDFVRVLLR